MVKPFGGGNVDRRIREANRSQRQHRYGDREDGEHAVLPASNTSFPSDSKKRSEFVSNRVRLFFWKEMSAVTNGTALDVGEEGAQRCCHVGDGSLIGSECQ
jgi:hypothetical protein